MVGRGGFLPSSSEPEHGTWEAKHRDTDSASQKVPLCAELSLTVWYSGSFTPFPGQGRPARSAPGAKILLLLREWWQPPAPRL